MNAKPNSIISARRNLQPYLIAALTGAAVTRAGLRSGSCSTSIT